MSRKALVADKDAVGGLMNWSHETGEKTLILFGSKAWYRFAIMIRLKQLSIILFILLIAIILLFHNSNPTTLVPTILKGANTKLHVEATRGKWRPSPEQSKEADIWRAFCHADLSIATGGPDGRDAQAEDMARSKQLAAWEWVLEDGSSLLPVDQIAVIERALKSRGGIMLTGGKYLQLFIATFC